MPAEVFARPHGAGRKWTSMIVILIFLHFLLQFVRHASFRQPQWTSEASVLGVPASHQPWDRPKLISLGPSDFCSMPELPSQKASLDCIHKSNNTSRDEQQNTQMTHKQKGIMSLRRGERSSIRGPRECEKRRRAVDNTQKVPGDEGGLWYSL